MAFRRVSTSLNALDSTLSASDIKLLFYWMFSIALDSLTTYRNYFCSLAFCKRLIFEVLIRLASRQPAANCFVFPPLALLIFNHGSHKVQFEFRVIKSKQEGEGSFWINESWDVEIVCRAKSSEGSFFTTSDMASFKHRDLVELFASSGNHRWSF